MTISDISIKNNDGASSDYPVESVVIHPIFERPFVSFEHPAGDEEALGDKLGRDFMVVSLSNREKPFPIAYRDEGKRNKDWIGWREKVLAPIGGVIEEIHVNPKTNTPGNFGKPPAGSVTIGREDGVHIVVAHLREIRVEAGEQLSAGDVIGRVGNNGHSFNPHIHLGAWKQDKPLQIQVNLEILGRLIEF